MKKNIIATIILTLLFLTTPVLAAYNDFVANGDVIVQSVQGDGLTADFKIFNGSTAESVSITDTGIFTAVLEDGSSLRIGCSDPSVKAMVYISDIGMTSCLDNLYPGGSSFILTVGATYTITPKSTVCSQSLSYAAGSSLTSGGGKVLNYTPYYPTGTLVRANNSDKVYFIDGGTKRWIATADAFNQNKFPWTGIKVVDPGTFSQYSDGADILSGPNNSSSAEVTNIPQGGLIRAVGSSDIYVVKYAAGKQFKHLILSPAVFNSYKNYKWNNIQDVNQSVTDSFMTSSLVRATGDKKVYQISVAGGKGQKHWIKTAGAFNRLGLDWDSVYNINKTENNSYKTGDPIQ